MKNQASKKVLLVDDEPAVLRVLQSRLEHAGYQVFKAETGNAAIQIAKQELPDLIILDVLMPGMDGIETNITLKKDDATKGIPVFFLTALQSKRGELQHLAAHGVGPDIVFSKPFAGNELLNHISTLFTRVTSAQ